ncbi:MAG: T9SS type A sorting domain-containing protein [Flavobacteriaceae bacterium]|nr:T9SS type A sorting domain-containing protein [Flavobacteriaceae bacterium]
MKINVLSIFIVGVFLITTNVMSQVMLKQISLEQQINNSTLVIEGEVISKRSFWNNNLIYTANTIKIYKVFKGEQLTTIDVITPGGVVENVNQIVSPSLKLNKGDLGVFTLYDNNIFFSSNSKLTNKQFIVYSSLQGFYKYNIKKDAVINPFSKTQGVTSVFYDKISSLTNSKYVEITKIDINGLYLKSSQTVKMLAPSISNFSPTTATAGTKMVLTINGSGFGSTKGKVSFSNADDGGSTYVEALDSQVLTWADNKITVEIPSEAGTGKIQVTDASSASFESTSDLIVTYSIINGLLEFPSSSGIYYAYPSRLVNNDGSGGYVWRMQTDFNADIEHSGAKQAFLNALDTWRCETGVNWTIGAVTTTDVIGNDDINVVRFDNGNELPIGVLGQCTYYLNGCGSTLSDFKIYADELDIVFDDGEDWYYGSGLPSINQYDFQSVALHELGHGHQLGHVIDTSSHIDNNGDIMYYAISNSEQQRVLHADNITAGNYIQTINESSIPAFICFAGKTPMSPYACPLSVEDEILKDAVKMYPNPTNGVFYISNELYINLKKAVIFDIRGRQISEFDISGTSKTKQINLTGFSKGMYLVNIHSDDAFVTKKLVLE